MELKDLKNGMIVELRKGNRFIIVNNYMLGDTWYILDGYNNDLTDKHDEKNDIVKIYEVVSGYAINYILKPSSDYGVKLLWERKEIDWSKVPFGTKVKCWDCDYDILEGKFIRYKKDEDLFKFEVLVEGEEEIGWKYCELVEDTETEVPTYGEIDIAFENYCRGQQDGCSKCEIRAENCEIEYILKNYNVTKK